MRKNLVCLQFPPVRILKYIFIDLSGVTHLLLIIINTFFTLTMYRKELGQH